MNIGKLNTLFRVFDKRDLKDSVGQRSIEYIQVTSIYGQHTIRNMTSDMSGNRENPMVSEYVWCHYDNLVKNGMYLKDDLGNVFRVQSLRRSNDRALLQMAVKNVTEKNLNIV